MLRKRLLNAIKRQGFSKKYSAVELVGIDIKDLKSYLENMFTVGMSWQNHGIHGWHIDHIKPLALFDLSDPAQQKLAFHYSNLQPLWATDNLRKATKYKGDV